MTTNDSLSRLSDAELLNEVKRLAAIEREATADLIRSLAEVEARWLHLAIGCSSMFGYCTQVLQLSEHAAYARIAAARAATRFPVVMNLLIEGAITLTTVTLLGRHLTDENHAALLEAARHKSKANVEMLVATLHPQPDVPSSVRKVPAPKRQGATASLISDVTEAIALPHATTPELQSAPPPQPAVVRAIAPERYKLQVTIGAETRAKLRRAQDLLRHTSRSADEAAVIDRALTVLVEQLEKVKYGRTDRPRLAQASDPGSRHVPAQVRRAVSARDGYRCAFVGPEGRCTETAGLQYHHRIPFGEGGPTTVDNLELRCPAHNTTKPSGGSAPCSCGKPAAPGAELRCPDQALPLGRERARSSAGLQTATLQQRPGGARSVRATAATITSQAQPSITSGRLHLRRRPPVITSASAGTTLWSVSADERSAMNELLRRGVSLKRRRVLTGVAIAAVILVLTHTAPAPGPVRPGGRTSGGLAHAAHASGRLSDVRRRPEPGDDAGSARRAGARARARRRSF